MLSKALAAIAAGLADVFGGKLFGWALLCFFAALGATVAAAWAAFHYLLPMIPEREGWLGFLWDAAEVLSGVGVVILAIALAPGLSMMVGSALFDIAAEQVEKRLGMAPGRMVPLHEGLLNGVRIAALPLVLNIVSLPLLFVPILNVIWFLALNGFLMGREFFSQAAVRHASWAEARAWRTRYGFSVFLIGFVCSFIPFVAPLVGASAMTRLIKAISVR